MGMRGCHVHSVRLSNLAYAQDYVADWQLHPPSPLSLSLSATMVCLATSAQVSVDFGHSNNNKRGCSIDCMKRLNLAQGYTADWTTQHPDCLCSPLPQCLDSKM